MTNLLFYNAACLRLDESRFTQPEALWLSFNPIIKGGGRNVILLTAIKEVIVN